MKKGFPLKKLIFVTGTDTGVGKTVITAGLFTVFREKGYQTLAVKPFQTGAFFREGCLISPDVMFYRAAGSMGEPPEVLNPVLLEPPAAPWVASVLSGTYIDLDKVRRTIEEVQARYDLVIMEGAGGLCVPIRKDFLMADLVCEMGCPLLIVARASLGTVNHTLLTVRYAQARGIPILGVVVNGMQQGADLVEDLNPWVIRELSGVPLLGTVPYSSLINMDTGEAGNLAELIEKNLNFDELEGVIFGKS
ncbi:MAG: dethiobiotin synthase [Bacillota bacterium]